MVAGGGWIRARRAYIEAIEWELFEKSQKGLCIKERKRRLFMRKGTSGLLLYESRDGGMEIGYCDYGVGFFGGGDYDVTYRIDKENANKLREHFGGKKGKRLKEKMIAEFGENLSEEKLLKALKELGVEYIRDSWVSFSDMDDER